MCFSYLYLDNFYSVGSCIITNFHLWCVFVVICCIHGCGTYSVDECGLRRPNTGFNLQKSTPWPFHGDTTPSVPSYMFSAFVHCSVLDLTWSHVCGTGMATFWSDNCTLFTFNSLGDVVGCTRKLKLYVFMKVPWLYMPLLILYLWVFLYLIEPCFVYLFWSTNISVNYVHHLN